MWIASLFQVFDYIYLHSNIFLQILSKKKMKHGTYTSDVAEFNMVMEVFGFSNLAHWNVNRLNGSSL